jgi:hypothetical protein
MPHGFGIALTIERENTDLIEIFRGFWYNGHFRYGNRCQGWFGEADLIVTDGNFRDMLCDHGTKFDCRLQSDLSSNLAVHDGTPRYVFNARSERLL